MGDLILTTFNWVPKMPRGYVRDIRVRWALEEAGLAYRARAFRLTIGLPSISPTSPSAKCRG
jgi:hypothetical protein